MAILQKRRKSWVLTWSEPGCKSQRRKSLGSISKGDAKTILHAKEVELKTGRNILIHATSGMYFEAFATEYRGRKCAGKAWKKEFPNASKESIREFLECLVDGMCFSSKIKLKFHPNDQVLDIYRSLYFGRTPAGDNMECETFLENLSASFSIEHDELLNFWHEEVTLGELYKNVTA